ncbi:Putative aliphatic sulfonates transport permease protein SsuC [Jannaschia seosinensis]|uniref:Putative aliphatic sulfonates transport permease protein SsuC n=1 Tax=Jannaschia seosinensis TaxID=313367 RepID=A0A0M7BGB5_9RHOB|nr:ABC transporter permease [Jannaschia seosinensis]CUH40894.1 Putative aliphatic sulfonates transport permease protein SsuC [Jannaschia seosinensis]
MTGLILLALYVALFVAAMTIAGMFTRRRRNDLTALKTVTFGDESAVRPNRVASVVSVLVLFLLWGAFTGSAWAPVHVPGPFLGQGSFTYTARDATGATDEAEVVFVVHEVGTEAEAPEIPEGEGLALNDTGTIGAYRSKLFRVTRNDAPGVEVVAVDGQPIAPGGVVAIEGGTVSMTPKGTLHVTPATGYRMESIWLPAPEEVVGAFIDISQNGFQNYTLIEHLGWSLIRVLAGFAIGAAVGIPLGYAMGLSGWFRGWFDPIVEFMRPVPPLALIPLVIIWFGIWETGKIVLLFLAALWIMAIAARAGVSGVNIAKIHAAYSLGANRWQILRHVIIPNSLPEIFTGARVAMGVCWGTVVAAELVAAQKGAGMMIIAASKFQLTQIVIMGIILIGLVGYGIDILMRKAETWLVPWRGRS